MKAVLHYRASPGFRRRIGELAPDWLRIAAVDETDRRRFRAEMGDAEVLLHVLDPVTAEAIAAAPRLRLIQKIGVGVNTIDIEAAKARGIAVANMPGTNTRAVAEMALLLMLAALRRAAYFDRATRVGAGWSAEPATFDGLGELAGRTVGLVGYGAVARCLAPVLASLGARVLCTGRRPVPDEAAEWRPLAELLAESDVVSLHLPLTPETAGLIDARALAAMRPGSVLINTARGGLVDEAALLAALRSGKLRAAGLDVFALEPVAPDNPLLKLDNVVLMPHIAWLTPETLERSLAVAIENCRRLRDGEPLLNRVV
ncbi:MAG: hydroxyacid dehydrogenase [Proteobacteria bacterium]|nr:hydroxyacid dehydrogenase [Pseudomonadota bacterium]